MSFHKCFYCEQSTKQTRKEIDHYLEVEERPELAFDWDNLYLSCCECNRKLTNRALAASSCVNPCDPNIDPGDHLSFDDEFIRAKPGSGRGAETIRKYRLDRSDLDHKRVRLLRDFLTRLVEIRDAQNRDGGRPMTEAEKEILRAYRQAERPFSLMFRIYLERNHL